MSDQKCLKLNNGVLMSFADWLSRLDDLSGRDSRMRTRFLKLCRDRVMEISDAQNKLFEKYGKRDENKKLVKIIDADGKKAKIDFEPEQYVKYIGEWHAILKEEFVIDILEGNKEEIHRVKEIVLNLDKEYPDIKIKKEEAEFYDEICTILEEQVK